MAGKEEFSKYAVPNMKRAYFSALAFLGSHDDAMEASQIAFVKAYDHFESFDTTKNFFTWYYKILKNHCLNVIRSRKSGREFSLLELKENMLESEPQQAIEQKEEILLLEKAMLKLSPHERELLIMREIEGQSYKQISDLLGIPQGSVMSGLFYARKNLAAKYRELL